MSRPWQHLAIERDGAAVTVTLSRPELHNAFNEVLVAELTRVFQELADDEHVRAIVLAGAGRSFSAGADLHWMRRMMTLGPAENLEDARALAAMYHTIDRCPHPLIARVHGAALGGGAGLTAVADIAVAAEEAVFGFSEVRLGIVPAVISPYVLAKIGARHARELFLTGERFPAARAAEIGLVTRVVSSARLDAEVDRLVGELVRCGPQAVRAAKQLIFQLEETTDWKQAEALTTSLIAERRASPEGQEGMRAFLEKRPPAWLEGKSP